LIIIIIMLQESANSSRCFGCWVAALTGAAGGLLGEGDGVTAGGGEGEGAAGGGADPGLQAHHLHDALQTT
jgi:hypothetical protein